MLRTQRFLALLLLLTAWTLPGLAEEREPSAEGIEALARAQALLQGKKYKKAEKAFLKLTEEEPDFGVGWMGLGLALDGLERPGEAVPAYQEAIRLGAMVGPATYNVACSYSRMNELDQSFVWLGKAVETGLTNISMLQTDPDLENARQDVRFAEILIQAGGSTCEMHPRYSEFDFWSGQWEARDVSGETIGLFTVTKALKGCLLIEVLTNEAVGAKALSFLFFDPAADQWSRESILATGDTARYLGSVTDGNAAFTGNWYDNEGASELSRVTWAREGAGVLRRTMERSADEGATWSRSEWILTKLAEPMRMVTQENEEALCEVDPKRSALDAWLGSWDVLGSDGEKLGSRRSSRAIAGCALVDRWGSEDHDALAWTYYMADRGEWIQNWVTANGDLVRYTGEPVASGIRFSGTRVEWDGTKMQSRSHQTIDAAGSLRHRIETSNDGGTSWNLTLDATYVRPKLAAAQVKDQP